MKKGLAYYMNITLRSWSILDPASISADGGHRWRLVEEPELCIPLSPRARPYNWHSNYLYSNYLYFYQTKIARNEQTGKLHTQSNSHGLSILEAGLQSGITISIWQANQSQVLAIKM